MVVSPFAKIQDSLPPLTPPPMLGFDPSALGGDQPTLPGPTPKVRGTASQTTPFAPLEGAEEHLSGKLAKDYQKDENPYGSPTNHPGVFGKILHGLNVATGGENRRNWEEMGLQKSLQDLMGEQSKEGLENAQAGNAQATAGKTQEETAEMPGRTESEEGLQSAQGRNLDSETQARTAPSWKAIPGMLGPNGQPIEYDEKTGAMRLGGIEGVQQLKQPRPDSPEQQYIDEYMNTHKGSTVADAERAYTTDTQRAPQALVFSPNQQGGYTAQDVRPGSTVAPGSQTAAGVNTVNTPTSQQRTAAGRAQVVVEMAPEVLQRIDANATQLGPVMGRWNDFMQGKTGMDNPDFAALRSDLLMMSSAVALAHAQGRLPENLREEFDNAINAPKQTPENLKATIQTMIPWLQSMEQQGRPDQTQGGGNPADTVYDDKGVAHRYKGTGSRSDPSNYEAVKK
jgi:hypothetical protein